MSRTDLRSFLTPTRCAALGAALVLPLIGAAQAQDDFPSEPIEIINMSSPGGGTDIFLRTLATCAQEELGTEIVVLSKTGGLGAAMINYAANRERDGHTLIALNVGAYVTASKGKTPVEADELIALVRGTEDPQFLIAKADSPLADAQTLIEEGRKRPIRIGGTHVGGVDWVAGMLFTRRAEFEKPLYVPFGGGADIVTNVIGGNLARGHSLGDRAARACDLRPTTVRYRQAQRHARVLTCRVDGIEEFVAACIGQSRQVADGGETNFIATQRITLPTDRVY